MNFFKKILVFNYRIFEYFNYFPKYLTRKILPQWYRKEGKCNECGECCVDVGIAVSNYLINSTFSMGIFLWTQKFFNGFHVNSIHKNEKIILFKCEHFDLKARECKNYKLRPLMCRLYPPITTFIKKPEFLEECGYFPEKKD